MLKTLKIKLKGRGSKMSESKRIFIEDLERGDNFNHDELKSLYQNVVEGLDKLDYYKDRELLFKVKDIFKEHKMMFETARMTREIAASYYKEGRIGKAIKYAEESVDILQNNTHDCDVSEALVSYITSIAVCYSEIFSYQSSLHNFKKCKEIINDNISDDVLSRYYHEYGIVCIYFRTYDKAKKLLNKALEYTDDSIKRGFIYNDIGRYYWKIKRPLDSRRAYDKAIELFKSVNDNDGLSLIYNNLAMLYYSTKKVEQAAEWIEKCFEIFDKSNPKYCIMYFDTYIRIILRKHDFGGAVDKLLEFIGVSDDYSFNKRYILEPIDLVVDRVSKFKNEEYGIKLKNILLHLIRQSQEDSVKNDYYTDKLYEYLGRLKYLFYPKTKRRN